MMSRRNALVAAALAVSLSALPACSSSSSGSGGSSGGASDSAPKTITVAYQKFGAFTQMDSHMTKVKAEYEAAHPGVTVKLNPIQADENDYYTKLNLMNRTASTAPDVLYEDTFLVNSDIDAGYLAPLDDYTSKWADWSQFTESAQSAGKGADGKTYGVPMGTDTRALYYNKDIFAKAGLPSDWKPKSWDDILAAARAIKAKEPDVLPFNIYSGKGAGEGSTMQGLEMLLYGTQNKLYDDASKKWITSSPGLTDSFTFLKTAYDEGLAPKPQDALDPQWGTKLSTSLIPSGKVGIALDGSWQTGTWKDGGAKPWPEYSKVLGVAPMPTQHGEAPGATSMSGGWLLAVGAKSKNKDAAFDFVSMALNQANTKSYDIAASQISERKDVSSDPEYLASDPFTKTFTDLVQYTHFRPAYSKYPRISDALQSTMETVMTDQAPVDQALAQFQKTASSIVGPDGATGA
jgi:multiple sugar transport system substrate-binding protein